MTADSLSTSPLSAKKSALERADGLLLAKAEQKVTVSSTDEEMDETPVSRCEAEKEVNDVATVLQHPDFSAEADETLFLELALRGYDLSRLRSDARKRAALRECRTAAPFPQRTAEIIKIG